MSTTPISYADVFDGTDGMQWGWLWANIDGRPRWHLVHTFEQDEIRDPMVRFINVWGEGDFEDMAEGYDGAPFVPLMPPGHVAAFDGQPNANRRVSLYWGDGSSSHYEWNSEDDKGKGIAAKAMRSVARLTEREDE